MRRSVMVVVLAVVALGAPAAGAQAPVDIRRDVEYGTANGKRLLLDAYVPAAGEDRRPAVVMIHGGGWRAGDKASWRPEAEQVAAKGWVAFSVNYRLDEPAVFPAEIDDVQAAVRWVRAHAEEYRVDPARIAAIGESAGGHLTAMLATLGRGDLDRDARIRVGAAWSPPVDLTALAGSRGAGWIGPLLGCNQQTCPDRLAESSPVTHVDGTDAPLYLVSSTEELVPLSQSQAMAERLKAAGVDHRLDVYPGNRHALDFRADAWAPTLAFLEKHLAAGSEEDEAPPFLEAALAVTVLGAAAALILRRRSPAGPERPPERATRP
ncbi:MAG TPA: alpha/beta hydrolase [Acidimicrobiales bacterium]|nr:alpha/beta hydrolase [Acidimicrobiales bacterium]